MKREDNQEIEEEKGIYHVLGEESGQGECADYQQIQEEGAYHMVGEVVGEEDADLTYEVPVNSNTAGEGGGKAN